MKYRVQVARSAERDMDKLPNAVHGRLTKRILSLEVDPRPKGIKKLSGRDEYRLRAGDYRVLFNIDDTARVVTVLVVRNRKDAYKGQE